MSTVRSRVRQAADFARPDRRRPPALPAAVRAHFTPPMLRQFRRLTAADQRHLLAVYWSLRAMDAEDDTCIAGLLHDVGKADARRRVTTLDRIANVLLRRMRPGWLASLTQGPEPPRWLHGLYLAVRHAELGAMLARSCGYNARVVWLIRHHEQRERPHDPQLELLVAADDAADSASSHYT